MGFTDRVFANGPGDLSSIPGRVLPKTQKWYLMSTCLTLSIIRYGSSMKWVNHKKGVAPSSTPWCCSYWKGSLRVTLDYSRQLTYLLSMSLKAKSFVNKYSDINSNFVFIFISISITLAAWKKTTVVAICK